MHSSVIPDIVVAGTVSLDLVASASDAPTASAAVGNSAANIAVRLSQAGHAVSFVTLLGADDIGDLVMDDLVRWGVRVDGIVRRPGYRTPIVYQITAGGGTGSDVIFSACPRCGRPRGSDLLLPDVDEVPAAIWAGAAGARAVLTDVAGGAGARLLQAGEALTWYEASLREAAVADMVECGAHAQIVKVSDEDVDFYRPVVDDPRGRTQFQVVTRGARGVEWRRRGGEWNSLPSRLVGPPKDTIGAGDAFTAGVVSHLVRAGGPGGFGAEALDAGAVLAAQACRAIGARGDMTPPSGGSPWIASGVPFHCGRCEEA